MYGQDHALFSKSEQSLYFWAEIEIIIWLSHELNHLVIIFLLVKVMGEDETTLDWLFLRPPESFSPLCQLGYSDGRTPFQVGGGG